MIVDMAAPRFPSAAMVARLCCGLMSSSVSLETQDEIIDSAPAAFASSGKSSQAHLFGTGHSEEEALVVRINNRASGEAASHAFPEAQIWEAIILVSD